MTEAQADVYGRYGRMLVDAGTLRDVDLPMLEAAARVKATLGELYSDPDSSRATIAAFERLHKEQLIQLGMTPAARRAVQRLETPQDGETQRLREMLE